MPRALTFSTVLFVVSHGVLWAEAPVHHVFKIIASDCSHEPRSRTLTGFRMLTDSPSHGIVTALHGVADCKSIAAVRSGERS